MILNMCVSIVSIVVIMRLKPFMFVFIQNLIVIMFYTLLCFMCEYSK